MSDPVLVVEEVSKRFTLRRDKSLKERLVNFRRSAAHAETFWALRDVSFTLEPATTLALIGHNGSGKSTLLKIIGGILAPNTGRVYRRGRVGALLELGAGFHGDLTGRENVYLNASVLGLSRRHTERYFDDIVEFSGMAEFLDTQVKFYSSGMYVRLAFAVAVHLDPEILLVDEVLAVGDEPYQRKCLERIKRFRSEGRTIILVTHGLDQVNQLCDRAIVLDHGRMVCDDTPVRAVRALRDRYAAEEELASAASPVAQEPPVRITGVRVCDTAGERLVAVDSGGAVVVEIDLEARRRVEDWVVGIALANHMDLLVYGTNTHLLGLENRPLTGAATARYLLPSLPLTDGQYYVTAAVHPPVGPEWHRLDRVATFRVNSDAGEEGVLHVDPKFEVVER